MKNILFILLFLPLTLCAQLRVQSGAPPLRVISYAPPLKVLISGYQYTLLDTMIVSIGIYKTDSTLVRTISNNVRTNPGTYSIDWDKKDDNGVTVPAGNYVANVLSNKITSSWQGTIGNNLKDQRGFYRPLTDMAFNSSYGYASAGYQEQGPVAYKFELNDPNTFTKILGKGAITEFVSADETNVYWGVDHGNESFVYITNVSDDHEHILAASQRVDVQYTPPYFSCINYHTNGDSLITGLAVQKTGNYLFISHPHMLDVVDKSTGYLVNQFPFVGASRLAVDGNDNLWMFNGADTVAKYRVAADGTITRLLRLESVGTPVALEAQGGKIMLADMNKQQVRIYDTTGTYLSLFGTENGYASTPVVSNDKFYWQDTRGNKPVFIGIQNDGTPWISDYGNSRYQHYSAEFSFIDRIQFLIGFYSTEVDKADPTRVFSDFLEFSTNYTGIAKDNWTLVNNWGYNVPTINSGEYDNLKGLITLSNGRTYATTTAPYGTWAIVELVTNVGIRFTGQSIDINTAISSNGDLYTNYTATAGLNYPWVKRALTGFDGSNNPIWASETTVQQSPVMTTRDPGFGGNFTGHRPSEITSSGQYIAFNETTPGYINPDFGGYFVASSDTIYQGSGYHIGAVKNNKWLWRTAHINEPSYYGDFPTDGTFDIGNGVRNYSGSRALTAGRYIIWGYHGEFWQNGQTNKWQLLWDNGLMLTQFGVVNSNFSVQPAGMAGNSYASSFVKVGSDLYLYTNDESYHSGIHRWRITGLNTIVEKTVSIIVP